MIDLSTWNLTLPVGEPPVEVRSVQLVEGYRDSYFQPDGSVIRFWTPVTGTSTANSSYPRTELREADATGKTRNWLYSEGTATLRGTAEVGQLPSRQRVIIAQIHAKDNPGPLLKLIYGMSNGVGYLELERRQLPGDSSTPVVMTYMGMPLDTPFDFIFKVSPTGKLNVKIAGMYYSEMIDTAWAAKLLYFKAGDYVPDNEGPETEGARVTYRRLSVTHQLP